MLAGDISYTLFEGKVLVAGWRKHYTREAEGFSGEAAQLTGVSSPRPGGAPALGSGLRAAQPSTQGRMTGRPVPHWNW